MSDDDQCKLSGQRAPVRFFSKALPNGCVELFIRLGEFCSLKEAEQAANETMHDLIGLWGWKQLQEELQNGAADLGTAEGIVEQVQLEICGQMAQIYGVVPLWRESQNWPGFSTAWEGWRAAFQKWEDRKFLSVKGPGTTRYTFGKRVFLADLRLGGGDSPDFYQKNAWLFFTAARLRDVEFFRQFAEMKRKKLDPRLVDFRLMTLWMPMALWTCQQDAAAKILREKAGLWNGFPPKKPGESLRRTWQTLGLVHERQPRIIGWTESWEPIFRD